EEAGRVRKEGPQEVRPEQGRQEEVGEQEAQEIAPVIRSPARWTLRRARRRGDRIALHFENPGPSGIRRVLPAGLARAIGGYCRDVERRADRGESPYPGGSPYRNRAIGRISPGNRTGRGRANPRPGGKGRMGQTWERVSNRSTGKRRRALAVVATLVGALATLGFASPALGSLKQDLQKFGDCPYNVPNVSECVYSSVTSGEFVIGKSAVPITVPVIIQGGLEGGANHGKLVPATDGNTLSKSPQPVPGGLVGIALPGDFTEVTATAELAGQGQIGTTVHLPLKTKLDNTLLGSNCYIGTDAEPMVLDLTYGTTNPPPPNEPISGSSAITTLDKGTILQVKGTLVDNAFAAPGATGCTPLPLVGDLAVNNQEGLPAAAGKNTAIQTGTTEEVPSAI